MREKEVQQAENPDAPNSKPKKRSGLGIRESTDFICGLCVYRVHTYEYHTCLFQAPVQKEAYAWDV